jgi:hypothetical protein
MKSLVDSVQAGIAVYFESSDSISAPILCVLHIMYKYECVCACVCVCVDNYACLHVLVCVERVVLVGQGFREVMKCCGDDR